LALLDEEGRDKLAFRCRIEGVLEPKFLHIKRDEIKGMWDDGRFSKDWEITIPVQSQFEISVCLHADKHASNEKDVYLLISGVPRRHEG
jgi:hypothetical protein